MAVVAVAFSAGLAGAAGKAGKGGRSRRADPRTGRLPPAMLELVKAAKRGDRAALGRVADRLGPAQLGQAVASGEGGVREAALAAVPLARGGVLLLGVVADQLGATQPERLAAAAAALGALLDGAVPAQLEEWDVPPDVVARACIGLRGLAMKTDAPAPARLAAIEAAAAATPSCGPAADLAILIRDPSPAVRRAATLVASVGERRESVLREAVADGDASVSAAAAATACRAEGRMGRNGKPEPPAAVAVAAARLLVRAQATPPDDAVEMLDCLAAGETPTDRALLEELGRRPPSPLRDRAVELVGAGKTQ